MKRDGGATGSGQDPGRAARPDPRRHQTVRAPDPRSPDPDTGRCHLDPRPVGGGRRRHGGHPPALRYSSRRPGHDRQREQRRARRADLRRLGDRCLVGRGEGARFALKSLNNELGVLYNDRSESTGIAGRVNALE